MSEASYESVISEINSLLSSMDADERVKMIEELKKILQKELMMTHADVPEMVCPRCGSTESIRYGKTRVGTQRWQCKECGAVRCHKPTGGILANTKLDISVWMDYVECFVDRLTCDEVADRLGVCHKTAWFMRLRTLQAIFINIPSFQVKSNSGAQFDEIFFRESFKGTRFDRMSFIPREARKDNVSSKRGISDEQICVITGLNDSNDFFFDVCCRGPLTKEIAISSLRGHLCSGAIINTDENRSYPYVMKELAVATHIATNSKDHTVLKRINNIHGDIRTFFKRFKGVSTRWLHLYLGWYKWRRCFHSAPKEVAAKQIVRGNYQNTWASIKGLLSPFRDALMNPLKC